MFEAPPFSNDIKEAINEAQNGVCKLCGRERICDFHHIIPNTKFNRHMFPLLVPSIFNCVGLCRHCHDNGTAEFRITEGEALAYEHWLTSNVKASK
jgi:5-methylcytosine-specific restriction endonuclease McrA